MIQLDGHPEGVVLKVRAQAGARRSAFRGAQDGALKLAVTQVAEKGKANRAILKLLGKRLGLRPSQLELVSGETSPDKRFLVRNLTSEQLMQRINEALG